MAENEPTVETPESEQTADLQESMNKAAEEVASQAPAQAETPAESPTTEQQPEIAPEVLKAIQGLDPGKLPKEFQDELFKKFQPKLNERALEWQKQQEAFQKQKDDLLEKALAAFRVTNNTPPGPSVQDQLREAIEANDLEKVAVLSTRPLEEKLSRIEGEMVRRAAYERAIQIDPEIVKNEPQIAEVMKGNPQLLRMAQDPMNLPLVLQGINATLKLQAAQAALAASNAKIESEVKARVDKALAERRANIDRMGTGLSSAGKTISPTTAPKTMDLMEAMEMAAREAGIS